MAGCSVQHTNVRSFFRQFLPFHSPISTASPLSQSQLTEVVVPSSQRRFSKRNWPASSVRSALLLLCCVTYAQTRQTKISGDSRRHTKSLPFFLSLPRSRSYHKVSRRRLHGRPPRPRGWRSRRRRRRRVGRGWMDGWWVLPRPVPLSLAASFPLAGRPDDTRSRFSLWV